MLNLQKEMKDIVDKNYEKIIVRRMLNIKCSCWRRASNTPDPQCPNCNGSGYIHKETLEKAFISILTIARVAHEQDFDYGKSYSNIMTAYMPISNNSMAIRINDIIFEIDADKNGKIRKPLTRLRKWLITEVWKPRLDGSTSQFVKILAKPLNTQSY